MDISTLHAAARDRALKLKDPDKKQLRFNEIVQCALRFYPADPIGGVRELVNACDRACEALYVKNNPMHESLMRDYAWMVAE